MKTNNKPKYSFYYNPTVVKIKHCSVNNDLIHKQKRGEQIVKCRECKQNFKLSFSHFEICSGMSYNLSIHMYYQQILLFLMQLTNHLDIIWFHGNGTIAIIFCVNDCFRMACYVQSMHNPLYVAPQSKH